MDAKLKQRVIGAVLLTSLAVIFLPLLLDGKETERAKMVATPIPEPPRIDLESLTVADVESRMQAQERASEARLPQEPKDTTDYSNTDMALDNNQLPVSWSLQLGTFRIKANATNLRTSLREQDYRAYILQDTINGQTVYRVLVGPDVSREALLDIGRRIELSLGIKATGKLVRYDIAEDTGQLGG